MFEIKAKKRAGFNNIALTLLFALLFLLLVTPVATAAMLGDINEDGEIDVRDVVLVQRHVIGKITLTAQQKALANVKGHGEIDARDVVLIMQYSLGLIEEFPHAALMVNKVTAVNAKQVEVEFNRVISPDELARMVSANFHVGLQASPTVNRLTGTGAAVAVEEDGKTVLLTMGDTYIFVNGSSTNRVVVKKEVGLAADFVDASVPYIDTTIPTLVSVHTESPRDIILTFSEPLDNTITPTLITIDGGIVFLNLPAATYIDARRELRIQSFTDFPVGNHTLTIASGTSLRDYSGFPVAPTSKAFTHTPLTTAPTVQAISSTETTVTLQFSRAINTATFKDNVRLIFRHTFDSTISQVDGTAVTNPSGDNRTFIIDFGSKILPPGSTNVWMKYSDGTLDAQKAKDTWGNIIAPANFTVNTVPDTTPPTATVTIKPLSDNKKLLVEYSKTVTGGAVAANYSLRRGIIPVPILTVLELIGGEGKRFEITVADSMVGEHQLTISNIRDTTPAQNAMGTQTFTINAPDTTLPVVNSTSRLLPGSNNKVQVFFSKAMNPASITDRTKYTYKIGADDIAVPDTVVFTPASNGKSVLLDFSGTAITFDVGNNITVGRVRDLSGNETAALSTVTTIAAGQYIDIEKAEATAVNRVTLAIDALITNVSPNDFAIDPGTTIYAKAAGLVSVSYSGGKTIIVLSTASDLPYTATGVRVRTEAAAALGQGATANARDEFGNKLNFNNVVVADKIAPVLDTAVVTGVNSIVLTFKEDINGDTFAPLLANGFSVSGSLIRSERTGAGQVTISRISGNEFVANTSAVSYNAVIGGVVDLSGNKLATFGPVIVIAP